MIIVKNKMAGGNPETGVIFANSIGEIPAANETALLLHQVAAVWRQKEAGVVGENWGVVTMIDVREKVYPDGEAVTVLSGEIEIQPRMTIVASPVTAHELQQIYSTAQILKHEGCQLVTLVLGRLPFARQDRNFESDWGDEANTLKVVMEQMSLFVDQLVVLEPHCNERIMKYGLEAKGCLPAVGLSAWKFMVNQARKELNEEVFENPILVLPDNGRTKIGKNIAEYMGCLMAATESHRDPTTGRKDIYLTQEARRILEEYEGGTAFVFEDMISTAGTLNNLAAILEPYGITDIVVMATDPIMVEAKEGKTAAKEKLGVEMFKAVMVGDTREPRDVKGMNNLIKVPVMAQLEKVVEYMQLGGNIFDERSMREYGIELVLAE